MDSEMYVKGKPLNKDEMMALLDLIEGSQITTSRKTTATNNKLKTQEWIRITTAFNATAATCPRTPQQLRLKWENLKKTARKRTTYIKINNVKTGGGLQEYIPPDDILDRVAGLLGSTVTGYSMPFGGDASTSIDAGGDSSCGGDEDSSLPECEVDIALRPNKPQKLAFATTNFGKYKKSDESKTARNLAMAEYFNEKKKILSVVYSNVLLENEKLKLENEKLKIEIDILKNK